jgi:hypothetical protein
MDKVAKDVAFVRFFELYDQYIIIQAELSSYLKNGFFDIGVIRRSGSHMRDFCSPTYIPTRRIEPFVSIKSTKIGFELVYPKKEILVNEKDTPTSTLVHRRHKQEDKKDKVEEKEIPSKDSFEGVKPYLRDRDISNTLLGKERESILQSQDPIYWYSLIPPDELRNAQKCFKTALQLTLKLAEISLEMNELEKQWCQ